MCLLANTYVGNQAEHRSTPVGATPGVSVVQALIAAIWFAIWHVANYLLPHFLCFQLSSLHACDRFHINRNPLFDPVMVVCHRGKCEMDHLVGEHPVIVELYQRGLRSHRDGDDAIVIRVRHAMMNTRTPTSMHIKIKM